MVLFSIHALSSCHDQLIVHFRSEDELRSFCRSIENDSFLAYSAWSYDTDKYQDGKQLFDWCLNDSIRSQIYSGTNKA